MLNELTWTFDVNVDYMTKIFLSCESFVSTLRNRQSNGLNARKLGNCVLQNGAIQPFSWIIVHKIR